MLKRFFVEWRDSIYFLVTLGVLAWVVHFHIPALIDSQTKGMLSDVGSLKASVAHLEQDVAGARTDIAGIRDDIKNTLNRALDRAYQGISTQQGRTKSGARGSLDLGKSALEMARDLNVKPDQRLLANFGSSAIATALEEPDLTDSAWLVARLSLAQHSNAPELQNLVQRQQWIETDEIAAQINPRLKDWFKEVKTYHSVGKAPIADCWIAAPLGRESTTAVITQLFGCNKYFRLVGDSPHAVVPAIDGVHFRNVIFENLRIVYKGGPVILEDVIFVNCEFDIPIGKAQADLGKLVLLSPAGIQFKKLS